jgi:RES domain
VVSIIHPPLSSTDDRANPIFHTLKKGTKLFRIYRCTPDYCPGPLDFRYYGPLCRFDHHQGKPPLTYQVKKCKPCEDSLRGIYYLGREFSCCLVEVFGNTPKAACITKEYSLAILKTNKDLKLLDIRNNGSMLVGANEASLAKVGKYPVSQAWSRYFYGQTEIYREIQGIIYCNAHNNEDSIVLYERAENLFYPPEAIYLLTYPELKAHIIKVGMENNINFIFPNDYNQ